MTEAKANRKAQRAALWLLYAIDVAGGSADDALSAAVGTMSEIQSDITDYWTEIESRVRGVSAQLEEIDAIIQKVSPRWKLERMARIDRNILRLGTWEIVSAGIPPIAVIDACVDLGKDYGEQGTGAFVNGLLDQICRDRDIAMR